MNMQKNIYVGRNRIKIVENQDLYIQEQKRLLNFFQYRTFLFFNVKESIFNRFICKMYILADIK